MGGFFMHSRPGIMTPFLSDEWFAAIKACIEEARASGMQAWLYDEWSFPSGFAGGAVTETRPELARKWPLCRPYQPGATGLKAGLEIEQWPGRRTELQTPFKTETESHAESNPEPPHAYLFAVTQDGYERIDPADDARLDSLLSDRNV